MKQTQITYTKTIVGYYNVTIVETGATYNVEPAVFLATTNVHERTRTGCMAIEDTHLAVMLQDRWTRVIKREDVAVAV